MGCAQTRTFRRSVQSDELTLSIRGTQVEYVQNFIYLGSISWNNDCTLHIIRRIQLATVIYASELFGRIRTLLRTSSWIFRQRMYSQFYYMLLIRGQLKKKMKEDFWLLKWGVTEICWTFDGIRKSPMTASDNNWTNKRPSSTPSDIKSWHCLGISAACRTINY